MQGTVWLGYTWLRCHSMGVACLDELGASGGMSFAVLVRGVTSVDRRPGGGTC